MGVVPVGGLDVPAVEVLFRSQVGLGQRGTPERDARFPADEHDRPLEPPVTQGCGGSAAGLAATDDHHRPRAGSLRHERPLPKRHSAKRGTPGVPDHRCLVHCRTGTLQPLRPRCASPRHPDRDGAGRWCWRRSARSWVGSRPGSYRGPCGRVAPWCPAAGGAHQVRGGRSSGPGRDLGVRGQAMAGGTVRVRRVYEEPEPGDGTRVLVDRIWPRGLTKAKAALDEWCKNVAPSDELRKWYSHDPDRFEEFARRYRLELQDPRRAEALAHLRGLASDRQLTLLTATRQPEISEAAVLAGLLRG